MKHNIILDADSYKASHFLFYPDDVKFVHSYGESRGGVYPETVFFGLQPLLQQWVSNPVTQVDIDEADTFCHAHGVPFNRAGWMHILKAHGGFLPLLVRAAPEGTVIGTRNVLVTVQNTDPLVPWLTSYVETALLRQVWYATTVATRIFGMKQRIANEFSLSADNGARNPALDFALLDFSSRGCASYGANEIGGAAYLANFLGSDSMPAVRYVNAYYNELMSGYSVPATEHSIMCSWTQAREEESLRTIVRRTAAAGGKIVSVVSDTWNVFKVAELFAKMADEIKAQGVTLVFRPDSGEAGDIMPAILSILANGFGTTRNTKDYHVLNGVKVLWGDGIDENTHTKPFEVARAMGISAESIMTGSGGGLMQSNINRDTCKFAFKASAISDGGEAWTGIAKDPITDAGKSSKKGLMSLVKAPEGHYETLTSCIDARDPDDVLQVVYRDGKVFNQSTIFDVRQRINAAL